jgi:hypothetical protein
MSEVFWGTYARPGLLVLDQNLSTTRSEKFKMSADPKRKTQKGDYERAKRARRHQEEALDDALKNTFPASDPVSIEQPKLPGADHDG